MHDTHLTLRLPRGLARALSRWARTRGLSRSQIAREAVAQYLGAASEATPARSVTARDVAARWRTLPRLTPEEAARFAADIEASRAALPAPSAPWE